jgi:hypothetical protein
MQRCRLRSPRPWASATAGTHAGAAIAAPATPAAEATNRRRLCRTAPSAADSGGDNPPIRCPRLRFTTTPSLGDPQGKGYLHKRSRGNRTGANPLPNLTRPPYSSTNPAASYDDVHRTTTCQPPASPPRANTSSGGIPNTWFAGVRVLASGAARRPTDSRGQPRVPGRSPPAADGLDALAAHQHPCGTPGSARSSRACRGPSRGSARRSAGSRTPRPVVARSKGSSALRAFMRDSFRSRAIACDCLASGAAQGVARRK